MGSIPQLSIVRGATVPSESRRPLHRLVEAAAAAHGPQPALLCGHQRVSFGALDAAASRMARALVRRCTAAGAPNADGDWLVAVNMTPSPRLVTTLLAVWKAGAAYLPLDPAFPVPRVRHILAEARPALVVAEEVNGEIYGDYGNVCDFNELEHESDELSNEPLQDKDTLTRGSPYLAIVLYTSGSTGVPKGVRLPHEVLMNRLQWQWRVFPFGHEERVAVFKTALTFVDSVAEIWGPLVHGRALLVMPKGVAADPERLCQELDQHKVERLVLVPSLLRTILLYMGMGQSQGLLRNLRLWVCSGEPLPPELARLFFHHFPSGSHVLCNFYGSTEVMGDVTFHVLASPSDVDAYDRVPIGRPLDNTTVYLLDEQFRPVVEGEIGELFVAGRNLAQGYVNGRDPHRFLVNPLTLDPEYSRLYRTGDYARIVKGSLLYEGRTDSQVKIRGHRVDLVEVERVVAGIPGLTKAVVLCYKPGEMNQALVTFVVPSANSSLTTPDIEAMLQKNLTSYMVPKVVVLENIPLLVNGKIDRQQLLKHYEETFVLGTDKAFKAEMDFTGVAEKNMDAAATLFETIATVLGNAAREKISLSSNFYELGGNSLNSVYTVTKLRDQGFIISITDFISAKDLSEVLEKMRPDDDGSIILTSINLSQKEKYFSEMLTNDHKDYVISMITTSFFEKADLEQWLMPHIFRSDYKDLMEKIWDPLVEKNLSFVVKTSQEEIVGVALNFDAHDEPAVEIHSKLIIVFDFLEHLEGPIRDEKLPQGKGQVLHSFMMATHERLGYQDNVAVIQFMEEEIIKLARHKGFAGVFTTNTSPLTQQLGTDIYKYKTLLDYQVNMYVAPDGAKPFGKAPNWQRAVCSWRPV